MKTDMKLVGSDVTPLPDSGGKYVFEFIDQMLIKKHPLFTEIKAIKENSILHLINVLMNIRTEFWTQRISETESKLIFPHVI